MTDITWILEIAITGMVLLLVNAIIPYIKSKTSAEQYSELMGYVKIAVSAAEQIYNGPGRGKEKKAYVVKWLMDRGFTVNDQKTDAMIESAVYDLKEAAK